MTEFLFRPCCVAGADRGVGYFVPTTGPPPEAIEVDFASLEPTAPPKPPSLSTAMHEASHALVLHVLGYRIAEIQIGIRNFVRRSPGEGERMLDPEQIAAALAGDMGGQLAEKWMFYRQDTSELDAAIARVKTGCAGSCDECIAARFALHTAGHDGTDEDARAEMRAGESLAHRIVSSDEGRAAIRALGHALIANNGMIGEAVHAMLEKYLPFGRTKETL